MLLQIQKQGLLEVFCLLYHNAMVDPGIVENVFAMILQIKLCLASLFAMPWQIKHGLG